MDEQNSWKTILLCSRATILKIGARESTQWLRCLLGNHEDLNLDQQDWQKSLPGSITLILGRVETVVP